MTAEHIRFTKQLVDSPGFMDLLDDFIQSEALDRVMLLRKAAAEGRAADAAFFSGELEVLERLPTMFQTWARKYSP